ncbi:MAG: Gfo/Idh/MocA family oxidoreductase [Anaerolineae bacterium]|nr:Gfo/Idh/MocA family oxidoreductase [Anaerolineae bacterium]
MSNTKLKVGIVGVGIGRIHIRAYQQLLEEVEVVALCDLNEPLLTEVADQYNVAKRYLDYQKMFASGDIEAVSVCLPNNLHGPVSIAALEAGLHVLCEKPLAENAASGQKVVEAVGWASTKFMMCFNRRYRADIQWMKQVIDSGELGRIYQVQAGWIRETGIPSGWFTNKAVAGGGPLIDLGVHMLDAVMWLLDYPQPLTVSGDVQSNFGQRGLKAWQWRKRMASEGPFGVEDSATAFIRLRDGTSLTLETSWASHDRPGLDDFFITFRGTEGSIKLYVANYAAENTLTLFREINGIPVLTQPAVKGIPTDHEYAIAEFVHCIRNDTAPTAPVEQGQTIMRLLDAIYQSAASGREIVMDETTQ